MTTLYSEELELTLKQTQKSINLYLLIVSIFTFLFCIIIAKLMCL